MDRADAPERLWLLHSWLLSQGALDAHRLVSERFAAEGVRKYHFTTLVALAEGGPASQADLGRRLSMDRSDMAVVVGELEREGLVTRARDEHDRRRNVVALTRAGRAKLRRLDARAEEAQAALLAPLSASERVELRRLLTRVVHHHADARAAR